MPGPDSHSPNDELSLTSSDIYLAAEQGVLSREDAEHLVRWGFEQRFNRSVPAEPKPVVVEGRKGLNLVTVVYYFGAMLMIQVFQDSFFFPFVLAFIGLSLILVTVLIQRRVLARASL